MHQSHWQRLSKSCIHSNTSSHQSQIQAAQQVLRTLGKQSSTQLWLIMNNVWRDFWSAEVICPASYMDKGKGNSTHSDRRLSMRQENVSSHFTRLFLVTFLRWYFLSSYKCTSDVITLESTQSVLVGCCGRCVLVGCVLPTWWAPEGGIKWSEETKVIWRH